MIRSLSHLILALAIVGLINLAAAADEGTASQSRLSALHGTWRMISAKSGNAKKHKAVPKGQEKLKMVVGGRFVMVVVEDGMIISSASGTCQLLRGDRDDRYIETVQAVSHEGSKWFVGPEQIYKTTIKGDRWTIEGVLKGSGGRKYKIEEIWKRVK